MDNDNSHNVVDKSIQQLRRYANGAEKIFINAEALYEEAQLLGEAGHFARATVLHQISMEECSKIVTLVTAASSCLTGCDIDEENLAKAFRHHKPKNFVNAYFAAITAEELAARARGDRKAESAAFKKFQCEFHADVNRIKNAGLYVDFRNGQFFAPVDAVDEATAIAFQGENAALLKLSDDHLRLLRQMVSDPHLHSELFKNIRGSAEVLVASKNLSTQQVQDFLMKEVLEIYKKLLEGS